MHETLLYSTALLDSDDEGNLKITACSGVYTTKHDMLMQGATVLKRFPHKFLLHNRKNIE